VSCWPRSNGRKSNGKMHGRNGQALLKKMRGIIDKIKRERGGVYGK
jgi:hypothetical protein